MARIPMGSDVPTFSLDEKKISFTIAQSTRELNEAYSLVYDLYVESGYIAPSPSRWRLLSYNALPTTVTLIAKYGTTIVATLTNNRDSALGLPVDAIVDLSLLRKRGVIGECSALAVAPAYRSHRREILFPLCQYALHFAKNAQAIDHLAFAVHPRLTPYFDVLPPFRKITLDPIEDPKYVNGAPAVVYAISLHEALRQEKAEGIEGALFAFFDPPSAAMYMPKITTSPFRQFRSKGQMKFFFEDLLGTFSSREIGIIEFENSARNVNSESRREDGHAG